MNQTEICVLPPKLNPGDHVGIAAPAGAFRKRTFFKGLSILKQLGFEPVVPEGIFQKTGYLAGSDQFRADILNGFFKNPDIKGILCARGGYGSLRILEMLDYGSLNAHPKVFLGFSDITAILYAIYRRCRVISFHAPMVTTLADADEQTVESLRCALEYRQNYTIYAQEGGVIKHGKSRGKVIGGNLTTLCHMIGTVFSPVFKNHLLLLEDRGEARYRIDRMLTQMKMAGCLEGVCGVIVGSFTDCGDVGEIYRLIGEFFDQNHVPVLGGFDVGHGKTNLTVPLGGSAELDTAARKLSFQPVSSSFRDDGGGP
jgi:muramoyltetrapeptide carboxypeptidase